METQLQGIFNEDEPTVKSLDSYAPQSVAISPSLSSLIKDQQLPDLTTIKDQRTGSNKLYRC